MLLVSEIRASLVRYAQMSLAIELLFIAALVFFCISWPNAIELYSNKTIYSSSVIDQHLFSLSDTLRTDEIVADGSDTDFWKRVEASYTAMISNQQYQYVVAIRQPIDILNFRGKEEFLYGYEYGESRKISAEQNTYNTIKSMQFNANTFEIFDLKLESGTGFTKEQYQFDEHRLIPAILGHDYTGIYNIGDEINVEYLGMITTIRVGGFMPKDSFVLIQGNIEYLDRYIILPSLSFNQPLSEQVDPAQRIVRQRLLLQQINGIVYAPNMSCEQVEYCINEIADRNGISPFRIVRPLSSEVGILNLQAKQYTLLILAMTLGIFILAVSSLTLSLIIKVRNNRRTYAIHLANGAYIRHIKQYVAGEIFVYLLVANLVTWFIAQSPTNFYPYNLNAMLVSVVVGCIASYIPLKIIDRIDMNRHLREEFKC